jgi:hypothetical protein
MMIFTSHANSQTKVLTDSIYSFVEVMPEFPGGKRALVDYISSETYLPINCKKENIDAEINVSFVIDTGGLVQNVAFKEKIACPEFEAVLKKIFYFMPHWKPGEQESKKVNVKQNFPIYINLE